MKKFLAVFVSAVLLLVAAVPAFAATSATPAEKAHLHFGSDGTFRILNLSDFQDDANISTLTVEFVKKAVEKYQPDVIVLTGDNIAGYRCLTKASSEKAIRAFMDVLEEIGVPVAMVFGNHDDEGQALTKQEQMDIYDDYSVTLAIDEAEYGADLSGCGTYAVPVYESATSDTVKFVLWMFDSGSDDGVEGSDNYDHVHADQIEWYKNESARYNAQNNGQTVYGIAFQHIIVNEVYKAFKEVDRGTAGAVPYLGKWYVLPDNASADSVLGEAPCPSYGNEGEFDAFKAQGNVLATVNGHDHANSFVIPYEGIDIICTATCGFCSYGDEKTRGGRIFDVDMNKPGEYETFTFLFTDMDYDSVAFNALYKFVNFWKQIYLLLNNLWVSIRESF